MAARPLLSSLVPLFSIFLPPPPLPAPVDWVLRACDARATRCVLSCVCAIAPRHGLPSFPFTPYFIFWSFTDPSCLSRGLRQPLPVPLSSPPLGSSGALVTGRGAAPPAPDGLATCSLWRGFDWGNWPARFAAYDHPDARPPLPLPGTHLPICHVPLSNGMARAHLAAARGRQYDRTTRPAAARGAVRARARRAPPRTTYEPPPFAATSANSGWRVRMASTTASSSEHTLAIWASHWRTASLASAPVSNSSTPST